MSSKNNRTVLLTVELPQMLNMSVAGMALFVLFEPKGLNGRWLKLKAFLETFPLYRRNLFKRGKTYMKSERYK